MWRTTSQRMIAGQVIGRNQIVVAILPRTILRFSSRCASISDSSSPQEQQRQEEVIVETTSRVKTKPHPVFIQSEATSLVDSLLTSTRMLMNQQQQGNQQQQQQHVVAFSGGVDSSLVAALLIQLQPTHTHDVVRAILGKSPALSQQQLQLARSMARHLSLNVTEVQTTEFKDAEYRANVGNACFACKTNLYSTMQAVMEQVNNNNDCDNHDVVLYNGTNKDDTTDKTRVGLIAASNFKVQSPLIHIPKSKVRLAAQWLGLPNYNHAASPCLRSRLALGVQATQEHLHKIELAEHYITSTLQLPPTANRRVRMLAGGRAAIELDSPLDRNQARELQHVWEPYLKGLGFTKEIQIRPFQSGSVSKQKHKQEPTLNLQDDQDDEQEAMVAAAAAG